MTKLSVENLPLIQASEIAYLPKEMLDTAMPNRPFRLVFEDGVIVTTKERTIWSWYLWKIHRMYTLTPLLKSHHIGRAVITPDVHIGILTKIRRDYHQVYNSDGSDRNMDHINKLIHESYNDMYNGLTTDLEEYVSGANILDILEMLKHPVIAKANELIVNNKNITASYIDERYKEVAEVLKHAPELKRNSVAIAYRSKLVKQPQLLQCVTARGFMSDVDGANFRHPMRYGYAQGMRHLRDYAADSRMASLSAFSQHSTMSEFQYTNRSLQILNEDLRNIHHVDCGTKSFTWVTIDSLPKLEQYIGKYIMNDYGLWEPIDITNKKLLNKPLRLRTLQDCKTHDRHGVCMRCFGDLYTSYVSTDGLGQSTVQHVQQRQSQSVLSVKHFAENAFDHIVDIPLDTAKYFNQPEKDKSHLYVRESFIKNDGKIIFMAEEIENINNLIDIDSLSELTISRYAKLTKIQCRTFKDNVETTTMVSVENGTSYSILTGDSLMYILRAGWEIDEKGNYVVSLRNWDVNKPFFTFPRRKVDMVAAGKRVSEFLKGSKKRDKNSDQTIVNFTDLGQALMAFQDMTIQYSKIRVSHIEVMLYGLLAADPDNKDYRAPDPLNRKSAKFVSFIEKVNFGNIATAMAYENQGGILEMPSSYVIDKRSPSSYEYYVMSQEDIERRNRKHDSAHHQV